jgi:type II secretory pathway pseudopilin PulG
MKKSTCRLGLAFAFIELLVVLGIIVILAALLLPPLVPRRGPPRVKRVQLEEAQIANAIQTYEADHGRFPVSSNAINAATVSGQDFSFGTAGLPTGLKTPTGTLNLRALAAAGNPVSYQANNSEVMAVLLDIESWPGPPPVPTINQGHAMNPHKIQYLNVTRTGDTSSPGIGSDGVYRDPWGQPYIITIDLNNDGRARDAFYREPGISADPTDPGTPKRGLDGLIPKAVGGKTFYEANAKVMVWSAGPDKTVNNTPGTPANQGANKDNILSWR